MLLARTAMEPADVTIALRVKVQETLAVGPLVFGTLSENRLA